MEQQAWEKYNYGLWLPSHVDQRESSKAGEFSVLTGFLSCLCCSSLCWCFFADGCGYRNAIRRRTMEYCGMVWITARYTAGYTEI